MGLGTLEEIPKDAQKVRVLIIYYGSILHRPRHSVIRRSMFLLYNERISSVYSNLRPRALAMSNIVCNVFAC